MNASRVAIFAAALAFGSAADASIAEAPPLDRPELRIHVENLRTTQHNCHWEFDWIVDNYGGVGASLTGITLEITGRTAQRELPPWRRDREADERVEAWGQIAVPASAHMHDEAAGCAFRADATFHFRDDRGLVFTMTREVSDRWRSE